MNDWLGEETELIVVDNASADHPGDTARQWKGGGTYIALPQNVGFGTANNVGVQVASNEAVVLLNPDTQLIDESLGELGRAAVQRGALIGPRLLNEDRTRQPSASCVPRGPFPWLNAIVPGSVLPRGLKARTEPWRLESSVDAGWLTGACIAAPGSLLRDLGPFDPQIHMYAEDMDLCLRALAHGATVRFAPKLAQVVHFGDASSSQRFPDSGLRLAAMNQRAVVERAFGPDVERSYWRASRLKLVSRLLAKRLLGRPDPWLAAVELASRGIDRWERLATVDTTRVAAVTRELIERARVERMGPAIAAR